MKDIKYLIELDSTYTDTYGRKIYYYFDTIDELYDYLNENKETIFNCGFDSKTITLRRINKMGTY